MKSNKSKTVSLVLCAFGFIGIAGLHHFYNGRKKKGWLYLLTIGLYLIGTIVDFVLILKSINTEKAKPINTVVRNYTVISPISDVTKAFSVENTLITKNSEIEDKDNYSRYFQKWDDSYDKDLGYEGFKICTERVNFPYELKYSGRLCILRNEYGYTQVGAAKRIGVSTHTLSLYENGHREPSEEDYKLLSDFYNIPLSFLKNSYCKDFKEHIELCNRFGEEKYIECLWIQVRAASRMFPEKLTPEDKEICYLLKDILNIDIDLFDEKAKAKEELREKIKAEILDKLKESSVSQKDLYASYEENRSIAMGVIKELHDNGVILKEKQGSTFLLNLATGAETSTV